MASGGHQDIQDAMECRICMQLMTDPRVLPCGHTFCSQCLELLVREDGIKCPTCRAEIPLGTQGVNSLPKNFAMIQMITAMNEQHMDETTKCIRCTVCHVVLTGIGVDEWSCIECKTNLCTKCASAHRGITIFNHHELLSLATINDMKCSLHPSRKRTHICVDCDVAVCSICIMADHRKQKIEDANKYLQKCKNKNANRWARLKEVSHTVVSQSGNKLDFEKIQIQVKQTFSRIQSEIDKTAEENIAKIKKDQANHQEMLAANIALFDQLVSGLMNIKMLESKMEELEIKTTETAPQKELTHVNSLALNIETLIGQFESSEKQLNSFSAMSIPKSWTASSPKETIGTINMTTEIESGLYITDLTGTNNITLNRDSSGNIGIRLKHYTSGAVHVTTVYTNQPAHMDGRLKRLDQVLAVNGQNIFGILTAQDVRNIIEGNRDTVTLTVKEPSPQFNGHDGVTLRYKI